MTAVQEQTPPLSDMLRIAFAAYAAHDYENTARLAEIAARHYPDSIDAWMLLCTALGRLGSVDEERAIERALRHVPRNHKAWLILQTNRANALSKLGRANDAVTILRSIESDPRLDAKQRDVVGAAYAQSGLFEDALKHCEASVTAEPNYPPGLYNYATALRYLGRLDESEAVFERLLELAPEHSLALASLAAVKKWTPQRNHIERFRAELERTPADSDARARLHYSLFKELHDVKAQPEEAWRELKAGADLCRKLYPFSLEKKTAYVDTLINTYNKERLARRSSHTPAPPKPIFVLGLPRSGTTLTERILASHSRVTAMGETTGFQVAMRQALNILQKSELDANAVLESAALDWSKIAQSYQRETSYLAGSAEIVTEKLPHNYEAVGPISLAFPDAPIIHVRRSPMDSLFGAYKIMFGESAFTWSYSLEDLAANYRLYRRLMRHWAEALGERLHVVTLEQLIATPEQEIRKLLEFCQLSFEDACLSPHESSGGVSTASSSQVRAPINSEGVGAWRRYAEQLEPLRAALERDAFVDPSGDPIWD